MKTLLTLLIWSNLSTGEQVDVYQSEPMPETECLEAQAAIWEKPFEIAYMDQGGIAWPVIDAACIMGESK